MRMISLFDGKFRRGTREYIACGISRANGYTMAMIDIIEADEFLTTVGIERKIGQEAMSAKKIKRLADSAVDAMFERQAIEAERAAGPAL